MGMPERIIDPYTPMLCRVIDNVRESMDVFSITLEAPLERPYRFKAGQFNMLYGFGIGESAISISSSPQAHETITHTIRTVGSVTNHLAKLKTGDMLAIRGPYGTAWPITQAKGKSVLLIAGGIGIAPLKPVIHELIKHRSLYKNITVLYGTRTPNDLIFQSEYSDWKKNITFDYIVDHADLNWHGNIGVVTSLIQSHLNEPQDTVIMMCGPEVMMRFCLLECVQSGVPVSNIYLSMERNMQCGFGQCGHCQWGPYFICKDGPVMQFSAIERFFYKKAL